MPETLSSPPSSPEAAPQAALMAVSGAESIPDSAGAQPITQEGQVLSDSQTPVEGAATNPEGSTTTGQSAAGEGEQEAETPEGRVGIKDYAAIGAVLGGLSLVATAGIFDGIRGRINGEKAMLAATRQAKAQRERDNLKPAAGYKAANDGDHISRPIGKGILRARGTSFEDEAARIDAAREAKLTREKGPEVVREHDAERTNQQVTVEVRPPGSWYEGSNDEKTMAHYLSKMGKDIDTLPAALLAKIWDFVDGRPVTPRQLSQIQADCRSKGIPDPAYITDPSLTPFNFPSTAQFNKITYDYQKDGNRLGDRPVVLPVNLPEAFNGTTENLVATKLTGVFGQVLMNAVNKRMLPSNVNPAIVTDARFISDVTRFIEENHAARRTPISSRGICRLPADYRVLLPAELDIVSMLRRYV